MKDHLRPVLVIEDSDEDFETVLDAAHRAGVAHEIIRARSGDEGLRLLLQAGDARPVQRPALVLMDLNTPQGDGREALRQIQLQDWLRAVPVVVLSTSSNPRDIEYCYANGANAFHVKPVQHPAHRDVLEQILSYWLTRAVLPG